MKRWLCIALAALFVTFSFVPAEALNTAYDDAVCFCDSSGMYLISYHGSHADIERVVPSGRSASLSLGYELCGVTAYGGYIVLMCNDPDNDQLVVYTYDPDTDSLDSFCVYGMLIYGDTDFCRDREYIYIEDSGDARSLRVFNPNGRQVKNHRFSSGITDMLVSYDGKALVICRESAYAVSGANTTALSGDVQPPLFSVGGNYYASVYGDIYRLSGTDMRYRFRADSNDDACSACIASGILYYPCGTMIYGYSLDGEKIYAYDTGSDIDSLYAYGDSIIAARPDLFDVQYIDIDEFTDLREPDDPTPNSGGNASKPNSGASDTAVNSGISSDTYRVDCYDLSIIGIAPGTTIAQFRSNMRYDGYSVRFYRDSVEKKSGNVGTAMTAVFESDEYIYTFELSVIGDLTGEGNRNSRDLDLLMDYLIGTADFNGVYSIAADLNEDNRIDAVDLALMKRLT